MFNEASAPVRTLAAELAVSNHKVGTAVLFLVRRLDLLAVNYAAVGFYGYTRRELVGMSVTEIHAPDNDAEETAEGAQLDSALVRP